MSEAKIEWYTRAGSDEKFALDNDVYAGTYTEGHPIIVDLQLWNNRWGTVDVDPLSDFYINIYFKNIEDSALLDYCTVILNNSENLSMTRSGNRMTLIFPKPVTLSGVKNDGTSKNNPNHFINLQFIFQADGADLKDNDLKALFFEIIKND